MPLIHQEPQVFLLLFLVLGITPSNTYVKHGKFSYEVCFLKPAGFEFTLRDATDIRQMHIFWNYRKPYNRSNPYSTTDFTNVTFNEHFAPTITVTDHDIKLRIGDSIFYWLLLVTKDWERVPLHKLNFWVKFDGVPEHFGETYYRDYENYHRDEL